MLGGAIAPVDTATYHILSKNRLYFLRGLRERAVVRSSPAAGTSI